MWLVTKCFQASPSWIRGVRTFFSATALLVFSLLLLVGCRRQNPYASFSGAEEEVRWIQTLGRDQYPKKDYRELTIFGQYPCPADITSFPEEYRSDASLFSDEPQPWLSVSGWYDIAFRFFFGDTSYEVTWAPDLPEPGIQRERVIESLNRLLTTYGMPDEVLLLEGSDVYALFWLDGDQAFGVRVQDSAVTAAGSAKKVLFILSCYYFPDGSYAAFKEATDRLYGPGSYLGDDGETPAPNALFLSFADFYNILHAED